MASFLHSWKMARPTEKTKEKKPSFKALKAFNPKIPIAIGMMVIDLRRMRVMIGIAKRFRRFFLCLRAVDDYGLSNVL